MDSRAADDAGDVVHGLDFEGFNLIRVPSLDRFSHIFTLNLRKNLLTELPEDFFAHLPCLTHLDLSYNNLRSIPASIGEVLVCSYNPELSALPLEMGMLINLQKVIVDGCPMVSPPIDIIRDGTASIVAFLRDRLPPPPPPSPRQWIVTAEAPPGAFRFRVMTYNILAESYATPQQYPYCASWALSWDYRKDKILKEILAADADILCLQEVESGVFTDFLVPALSQHGYLGAFQPKTRFRSMDSWERARVDGCAVFWRSNRFTSLLEQGIEFAPRFSQRAAEFPDQEAQARLFTRDNVALNVLLEALPSAGRQRRLLLVSNSHIHWNPAYSDVKLMQAQLLLEECDAFSSSAAGGRIPSILCGDLNSGVSSGVYAFLRDGRLRPDHPEFLGYRYGPYSGPGATGLRHNFRLASAYAATGAEPPFTNYTGDFVGTLDYIWYTHETMGVTAVVQMVDAATARRRVALPNAHFPSDHLSLVADFVLK